MYLAEIDPIQIIIIVIAMGAGFLQWLWGLFKQSLAEKERRSTPVLTPEERAAREAAWRRQIQEGKPQSSSPRTPPPAQDPWATVRDVFEQIKEEARKAQEPQRPARPAPASAPAPTPPPLPANRDRDRRSQPPSRSGTVRADLHPTPKPPPVPAAPFPAAPVRSGSSSTATASSSTPPVSFAPPPVPPRVRINSDPLPSLTTTNSAPPSDYPALAGLLRHPHALRQAVLLREILGPPKALQSSDDSAF